MCAQSTPFGRTQSPVYGFRIVGVGCGGRSNHRPQRKHSSVTAGEGVRADALDCEIVDNGWREVGVSLCTGAGAGTFPSSVASREAVSDAVASWMALRGRGPSPRAIFFMTWVLLKPHTSQSRRQSSKFVPKLQRWANRRSSATYVAMDSPGSWSCLWKRYLSTITSGLGEKRAEWASFNSVYVLSLGFFGGGNKISHNHIGSSSNDGKQGGNALAFSYSICIEKHL